MTAVVIEDEMPAARLLSRKLEKLHIQPVAMLHSVAEAVEWFLANRHPDLIFLDIQLSDGLSFEIFDACSISSPIIFTTAYDEYALKAFKLNSIDYLLKPIDEDDLQAAVAKFRNQAQAKSFSSIDFDQIKLLLTNPIDRGFKQRFSVRVGHQLKVIPVEEVECFYSENKGTYLHTLDNRDYLLDTTLELLEQELDPKSFFRISRKFILPLSSVREITLYTNSRLKVLLPTYRGDEVVVSRERVPAFRTWLD
ncbi:MAG TPA: LytTR family DNA-binding domain-containing protein [Flavobacterium sp.]|nr:LytTR family DNA-binding domain-containing protein [Flavobacterium sp.]